VGRGRFRTGPSGVEKWFTDLPPVRTAMEAGTHSIWISEQLQELGHEVIVANTAKRDPVRLQFCQYLDGGGRAGICNTLGLPLSRVRFTASR
jgi:hypothetical protein